MAQRMVGFWLGLLLLASAGAAEEERIAPLLLPAETLQNFHADNVAEYRCAAGQACQIACEAGPGPMRFEVASVQRMELARGETHWLMALRAAGKDIQGLLPIPVGCRFEGLVLERMTPAAEVEVTRPIDASDIIFEIQPQ